MDQQERRKRLAEQVAPNRRDFVMRVLGGAFVPPLIATFSMDALTATSAEAQISPNTSACLQDPGYVGPNVFECHFFDPGKKTLANGEVTIVVVATPAKHLETAIVVSNDTIINSTHIVVNGQNVASVPRPSGTIERDQVSDLCSFDELLLAMGAAIATITCDVTFEGERFTLTGPIIAASAAVIKIAP